MVMLGKTLIKRIVFIKNGYKNTKFKMVVTVKQLYENTYDCSENSILLL